MSLSDRKKSEPAGGCRKCQHEIPGVRAIHWLRFPSADALAGHLRDQPNGMADETSGFINSRCVFWRFVHNNYGDRVDNQGVRLPAWWAWIEHQGGKVVPYDGGYRILRRPGRKPAQETNPAPLPQSDALVTREQYERELKEARR